MKAVLKVVSFSKFCRKKFSSKFMDSGLSKSIFSIDSNESESSSDHGIKLKLIQTFIPKLTSHLHKGQCGRIGVIGGSFEFTGAPYFSAISSLKLGADLVHVFCCQSSGPVIKSYSPELMVHPVLDLSDHVKKIEPWLERLHVLVIGPGLGRNKDILKNVGEIIIHCKTNMSNPLPLVIDADGLFLLTEDLNLIKDYRGPVILTPNAVEYNRLSAKLSEKDPVKIAETLNVVLLQKGASDVITNGILHKVFESSSESMSFECDVPGSNRRCGGQGDILSGCVATFIAWANIHLGLNGSFDFIDTENKNEELVKDTLMLYSAAVYGGCVVTRTSSRLAFEMNGRGMTASDMILCISKAFRLHFGL